MSSCHADVTTFLTRLTSDHSRAPLDGRLSWTGTEVNQMRRGIRERVRGTLIAGSLLVLALTPGVALASQEPAPPSSVPNLAGRWELNVQASDPPPGAMGAPGEGDE